MLQDLAHQIFKKQQSLDAVPPNDQIAAWASNLICLLYPELSTCVFQSEKDIYAKIELLKDELTIMLRATKACCDFDHTRIAKKFFSQLAEIHRLLDTDIEAIHDGDPAAKSEFEVIRAYPGFYALGFYRIAHALLLLDVPLLPRILTEHAHMKTGIDIHPGARIGEFLHIDHGTGIVIGETSVIGDHVKMYQGVTLGAISVDKSMASVKRHPSIEDHVILYSNATVLGGDTVVGHHSVIGGNVWLTHSVPPGSLVHHNPEITVLEGKALKY